MTEINTNADLRAVARRLANSGKELKYGDKYSNPEKLELGDDSGLDSCDVMCECRNGVCVCR